MEVEGVPEQVHVTHSRRQGSRHRPPAPPPPLPLATCTTTTASTTRHPHPHQRKNSSRHLRRFHPTPEAGAGWEPVRVAGGGGRWGASAGAGQTWSATGLLPPITGHDHNLRHPPLLPLALLATWGALRPPA